MAYLIDTTILARLGNSADAKYALAMQAVLDLHRRGETLHVTPQVLIEFRNVPTRPVTVNGLSVAVADVESLTTTFEGRFTLLPETPEVYPPWKALVGALGVVVTHLLTFNGAHLNRMATLWMATMPGWRRVPVQGPPH